MDELRSHLKTLISASGLSGNELPIRNIINEAWQPLVDEITFSRLGSLHALRRGSGEEPRPRLLLAAHMDAIGLIVTTRVDAFLRFTSIGGVDPRILPGQLVVVHGREDIPGMVVQPPNSLLPPTTGNKPVEGEYLWIDTGLLPERLAELARPGDLVSFAQEPLEMSGDTLGGHSLDNRASVAALTVCLKALQTRRHIWDIWCVATAQEETTFGGAYTSTYEIHPDVAVAVDVTFAKGPGASDYNTYGLGKGPTLGWGPNIHPRIFKTFKEIAEELEVPYQTEVFPRHSGTDGFAMQVTAEGVPNMVVSIPLRYMHTPVEVVSLKDINRVGRLLAEFCVRLDGSFMEKLSWENNQ